MPKRSSNPKRPRDINQLAASIVEAATTESAPHEGQDAPTPDTPTAPEKNPAAVALGKLGGAKGGPARAKKLTPEQRKEIAKKAAAARWGQGNQ